MILIYAIQDSGTLKGQERLLSSHDLQAFQEYCHPEAFSRIHALRLSRVFWPPALSTMMPGSSQEIDGHSLSTY